jgi:DNA-directed RNA polymerase specialized sigma24 family protein
VLEHLSSPAPEQRERARAAVAAAYWSPLYKYLRLHRKLAREDAEDLVQGFLSTAFERGWLDRFDPARARFRTFMRVCADRYVANWRQAAARHKRGGGAVHLPLDFAGAEEELGRDAPRVEEDRDALFDREFVRALFARAVDRVRADLAASGRERQFALFERHDLSDDAPVSYADLASAHGLTVTQVTNHLHAVRRAFRARVLEALREVCASEEEFRAEAREILGVEWP